jgi:hypothetical protein
MIKIDQSKDFFGITADVFRLITPCYEALRLNLSAFLAIALIPLVILMLMLGVVGIPVLTALEFNVINIVALAVLGLFLIIAGVFLWPAMIITQLESVKGKKVDFHEVLKKSAKIVWPFLGLTFLTGLITILGFILLILPGFLAVFFLTMATYIYVDNKPGIKKALKQSYQITKANWRLVFAMYVVNFLISFIGLVPVIGSVVNIALTITYLCLPALIYMQIRR